MTSPAPASRSLIHHTGYAYFPIAFVARLPFAMMTVGVLALVVAVRGSVALGGLTSAAVGVGVVVAGPILGDLADRFGQRRVLVPVGLANGALVGITAGLGMFFYATWQHVGESPMKLGAIVFLAMMGIGGIIAVTGALAFILIAVKSVFFGEPVTEIPRGVAVAGIPQGLTSPPVHAANVDEVNAALHAPGRGIAAATPGTLVLVGVFLVAFMLYYFTNWKLLSFLWKIG